MPPPFRRCCCPTLPAIPGHPGGQGLTLIELLVAMTIVGLLIGTGMPLLGKVLSAQEVRASHSRLFTHLSLARTTAITEGRQTVLCPSADASACSGATQWQTGWISFVDVNRNRRREPEERLLQTGTLPAGISLQTSRARRSLRFLPSGASPGSNLTMTICHRSTGQAKAIILSNVGRARSSLTRPDGNPLICA